MSEHFACFDHTEKKVQTADIMLSGIFSKLNLPNKKKILQIVSIELEKNLRIHISREH